MNFQEVVAKYTSAIEKGHIQIVPTTYMNMGGSDDEAAQGQLSDELEKFKNELLQ